MIEPIGSKRIERLPDGLGPQPLSRVDGSLEPEGAGAGVLSRERGRGERRLVPSHTEAHHPIDRAPLVEIEDSGGCFRSPVANRVEQDAAIAEILRRGKRRELGPPAER